MSRTGKKGVRGVKSFTREERYTRESQGELVVIRLIVFWLGCRKGDLIYV